MRATHTTRRISQIQDDLKHCAPQIPSPVGLAWRAAHLLWLVRARRVATQTRPDHISTAYDARITTDGHTNGRAQGTSENSSYSRSEPEPTPASSGWISDATPGRLFHAAEGSYNINMIIPLHTMFLDIPLLWAYQHLSVFYV